MGFTVRVQLKPYLLTRVPADSVSPGLSGADCAVTTILYCMYQQRTPIYVPFLDVCFAAVFCIIISAVGTLFLILSHLYELCNSQHLIVPVNKGHKCM